MHTHAPAVLRLVLFPGRTKSSWARACRPHPIMMFAGRDVRDVRA